MKKILLTGIMICFLSSAHSCPTPTTPQDLAAIIKNSNLTQEQRGTWWTANEALKSIPLEQVKEIKLKVATGSRCTYEVFSENHKLIGTFILSPR